MNILEGRLRRKRIKVFGIFNLFEFGSIKGEE
jgi:hypothetical protein